MPGIRLIILYLHYSNMYSHNYHMYHGASFFTHLSTRFLENSYTSCVYLFCRLWFSLPELVKDMMDLESVHMSYLTDSLHICFLSDETKPIASTIENILQCALDFRSCLTGDIWNVGLAEGDLQDKLSKINISQVTIKL
ncbi:hypothetical protein Gotur_015835 [Gossypium turneri]